jgi:hypothetical protein
VTESEWLECTDVTKMLVFLHGKASDRKLRLFSIGCIRRGWHLIDNPDLRHAVEALERFVDGCAKDKDRIEARKTGLRVWKATTPIPGTDWMASGPQNSLGWELYWAANKTINLKVVLELGTSASSAVGAAFTGPKYFSGKETERVQQKTIVLDIFGNPFRPVILDSSWLTPTVLSLAQSAYDNRQLPSGTLDNDCLAVLADALEEAGAGGAILEHLRSEGPHVRGCFALDLLLDME